MFLRNNQNVRLTTAGKMLADRARPFVDEHDAILKDVKRLIDDANSRLNIGYLQGASSDFLDVAFKLFRRNRPDTMLMARSMQPDQILEKLKMDEIDIGTTMRRKGAESSLFDSRTLYEDEFVLMMSSTHKLASNEALAPTDIVQPVQIPENFPHEPNLNKYLVERLDKAGINHVSSGVIDDMESMPLMLSDRSKTVVSCKHLSGKFGSRFKHIPLADVDLSYEICALWKKSKQSQAVTEFADCLAYSLELSAPQGR